MNNFELQDAIDKLNKKDIEFMRQTFSGGGKTVLRKFMNSATIKQCNRLVKLGVVIKGTSPDKHQSVLFYVDSWVWERLP